MNITLGWENNLTSRGVLWLPLASWGSATLAQTALKFNATDPVLVGQPYGLSGPVEHRTLNDVILLFLQVQRWICCHVRSSSKACRGSFRNTP